MSAALQESLMFYEYQRRMMLNRVGFYDQVHFTVQVFLTSDNKNETDFRLADEVSLGIFIIEFQVLYLP